MDCLADTNVLIRSIDRLHSHHSITLNALDRVLPSGGSIYITAQNVIEFWSVCTRPLNRNGLGLSGNETEREISRLESLSMLLPDVPAIFPEWRRLATTHGVSGVEVSMRVSWPLCTFMASGIFSRSTVVISRDIQLSTSSIRQRCANGNSPGAPGAYGEDLPLVGVLNRMGQIR